MKKLSGSAILAVALLACASADGAASEDQAKCENFTVAGHNAFVILPPKAPADKPASRGPPFSSSRRISQELPQGSCTEVQFST